MRSSIIRRHYAGAMRWPAWLAPLVIIGCAPEYAGELPALPDFPTTGFLPVVTAQMDAAISAVNNKPRKADVNGHYAMVLHAYEQFEPSIVMYQRAVMLDKKPVRWLYLQAHALAARGRGEDAIAALERALGYSPDDPWINIKLAIMRRTTGVAGPGDSTLRLTGFIGAHDHLPELHYALGRLYAMDGEHQRAIHHYERALKLAGSFGAAHYGIGIAYQRLGDLENARSHLSFAKQFEDIVATGSDPYLSAIESLDYSDGPLIKRAKVEIVSSRLEEAVKLLNAAIERNPQSVAAHISLIGLYGTLGEYERAEYHYERARALEPERAKLHYNLGLLRLFQKRYVEAEAALRSAMQRDRQSPDTFTQLALILRLQGKEQEAIMILNQALETDPANRAVRLQLAEIELANKQPAAVIALLEGYYEPPDGGSAFILLVLSKAYNRTGEHVQASRSAQRGMEIADNWRQRELINQFKRQLQLATKP